MRHLIHAEWTKFRTVRGWVIGMLVAIPLTVLVGLLGPAGSQMSCAGPDGQPCENNVPPTGPGGEAVHDSFYFLHRTLTGDGTITARVATLTDAEPWSKAGVIVKRDTEVGSTYAAVLLTGGHGVRMQHDFTEDVAGPVSTSDHQWLRLTRDGNTLTGTTSPDGEHWATIGSVQLGGLGDAVQAGMFVSSPEHVEITRGFGSVDASGGPTMATATFDDVSVDGGWAGDWRGTEVGGESGMDTGHQESGGEFTITGHGDIAPIVPDQGSRGRTVENALIGVFAGLIAVLVVATLFVTSEHRRGLLRTSLAASPRRGQLFAAKAVVIGGVSFVTGVASAALAIPLVEQVEVAKGMFLFPASTWTEVRVVLGTGLLFAVGAVLALAVGMLLRRSAGTVTTVVVGVVLPYLLAVASVLPSGPAEWLTAVTPAAGFAVQQTVPEYPQVNASYTPADGYFPLSPGGGFAVLCAYAVAAVVLAVVALRRRDA
ncbi:ABC transporter permease subunit [Actinophytocola algeriensis]|uniref:ABC-type transport system involved in multi-copper enzyme maturation permease subunit/regulation of enolase protein 1 (Concanavalin A-like superfamily) n=1 Tax=Actinophytocola algeriensis TaxID=1768010 RepID=A0A7W7VEQ7_9PSEU|nr:ABC transporter permease subunit [Actinophytocola algeriensis]MBB4907516.1 ABC-type transport system involved in multi-copper enzyme maturation permease subunit/regulation of enolase protein 1 (concanavalin A-like superfamily) [Actinophytocola algeriensis]MBE1479546.1 ABC-type transport system involved in multi-copper enzyme maturation permease subunit/regulation of enolase protein 1 (concanavalin A-like superfamily) [Actinophytocola algeriensis]